MQDPNHKGNVADLAIATEAARLGLSVLKPLTEHERYDLALGIGDRLLRVQCKWTHHDGDVDLLPAAMVTGRHMIHLRTSAPRNNQRAAINFAADYELGAVAQRKSDALAARRSRVRIPPAPSPAGLIFPDQDGFPDLDSTVGMDEFYAKLAQYVRRAEAGNETLVTRWGRPVARLGPAKLK